MNKLKRPNDPTDTSDWFVPEFFVARRGLSIRGLLRRCHEITKCGMWQYVQEPDGSVRLAFGPEVSLRRKLIEVRQGVKPEVAANIPVNDLGVQTWSPPIVVASCWGEIHPSGDEDADLHAVSERLNIPPEIVSRHHMTSFRDCDKDQNFYARFELVDNVVPAKLTPCPDKEVLLESSWQHRGVSRVGFKVLPLLSRQS